jgi:4-amino-4-deoxy-L-arabinose transferase-like glycosyltransferase
MQQESFSNLKKIQPVFWVLILWIFVTFWNLDKAFHIDDVSHIEIASWIIKNPWHPMSGYIYFSDVFTPINQINQPPLYFYLMALWEFIFGVSEISVHVLISIFALWAIFGMYRLSKFFIPKYAILATILFALNPAFVVGQNTMVDIPLIAVVIEYFYQLLKPRSNDFLKYLCAGLLFGFAILIKYTALILLPGLFLEIFLTKKWRNFFWLLLPLGIIAAWSLFNFYDYGGYHLFDRPHSLNGIFSKVRRSVWFIGVLGAICPFSLMFFYIQCKSSDLKKSWIFIFYSSLISYFLVVISPLNLMSDNTSDLIFNYSFLACGFGMVALLWKGWTYRIQRWFENPAEVILSYWIISTYAFIVLLAPFIATRHVLFLIPPFIILLFRWAANIEIKNSIKVYAVTLTLLISSLLAVSDNWFADIYRVTAPQLMNKIPSHSKVWFTGPWGWQWYAIRAGMTPLDMRNVKVQAGEYYITVNNSNKINCMNLKDIDVISIHRTKWYQRFSAINFYISDMRPWEYSREDIETFKIFQFTEESTCVVKR